LGVVVARALPRRAAKLIPTMLDNAAVPDSRMPDTMTKGAFWLAILVLSGLQLMVILDGTVVLLALPRIQERMGFSSAGVSWVITAYGLTYGSLMLLGGRIGDAFGRKRMLVVGVAVFTVSSLLCGCAVTGEMLLAARVLQGVGAAIASPTAMALVAVTFPPGPRRNLALAVFGSMVALGSVGGMVVGGALTQFNWRWIFLINVPIGALILLGAVTRLHDTVHHRLSLDVRGAVLATLGCALAVFGGLEGPTWGWRNPAIIGALAVGVLLLLAFVVVERHTENPLLPWSLFESRDRVAALVGIVFSGATFTALTVYFAQFAQNILGYSPMKAGLAFIPFTIAMGLGSVLATRLVTHVQPRWLLGCGAAILVGALTYGSGVTNSVSYFPALLLMMTAVGVGVGLVFVPLPLCVLVGVRPTEIGPLSAIGQVALSLSGPTLGLGVVTPMVVSKTTSLGGTTRDVQHLNPTQLAALSSGYTLAFAACAVGAAIAGLIALTLRFTPQQIAQAHAAQVAAERGGVPG
jgi:EmrB/QacA subfamily drug resistance transporter